MSGNIDVLDWHAHLLIERWDEEQVAYLKEKLGREPMAADFAALAVRPYAVSEVEDNLLTTAGLTRITSLITGAGGTALTNTTARLGTGNGAGGAAIGDTDLGAVAGAANRWYQIMDATFPTTAAGVITVKSTFASVDGNYAWNEWGTDIAVAVVASSAVVSATLLNHKTGIAQGTKTAGQVWAATGTITLS